jgi:hypothetical protein
MRTLLLLFLAFFQHAATAQTTGAVYGGVDAGYGIIQMHDKNAFAIDSFSTAKGGVFFGYKFNPGFATEVAYLVAREKMTANHDSLYDIKLDMIDVGLLYHSTVRFPGLFVRPSLGLMMFDIKENKNDVLSRQRHTTSLLSFGIGFEHRASKHLSLRILHTTHLGWQGDRMNSLKLGMNVVY